MASAKTLSIFWRHLVINKLSDPVVVEDDAVVDVADGACLRARARTAAAAAAGQPPKQDSVVDI
jgi:hypothetical protein